MWPGKTFQLYETIVAETIELAGDMAVKKTQIFYTKIKYQEM